MNLLHYLPHASVQSSPTIKNTIGVSKSFLLLILLILFCVRGNAQYSSEIEPKEKYYQVKISLSQYGVMAKLQMMGILDHAKREGNALITVFSESELELLRKAQIFYEIAVEDLENYYQQRASEELQILNEKGSKEFIRGTFNQTTTQAQSIVPKKFRLGNVGGFLSINDVAAELDSMVANYPNLISKRRTLGSSGESRPIWYVELGSESSEGKPQVLYTAMHHAREPGGMMALIYFMWWLLENYSTDPEAKALLDSRRMTVVPIVNPDGYAYNIQNSPNGGGLWRKNRKRNSSNSFGVDLNRNYGTYDFWNSAFGGSSTSPSSDTYRGTDPFSEPETAALRDFIAINQFKAVLNYHTFSNLLIYPYGYARRETPDAPIFREYAKRMTEFNGYTYGLDIETVGYNTRGTSDDWMYGDSLTKPKMIAMTPEVGAQSDGFWPVPSRITGHCQENLLPNLFLAWAAGPYFATSYDYAFIPKNTVVSLPFTIKNIGLESGKKVKVSFNSDNLGVQFLNQTMVFDSIGSWESIFTDGIKVKISSSIPDGPMTITMNVAQDGGYVTSVPYSIALVTPLSIRDEYSQVDFALEQNYPNPFNPSTIIKFSIPSQMQVRLEVIDVMGRNVVTLQNGLMRAGSHSFTFDGSKYGLTSGVYFYRLITSGFQQTRKMMLLK